MKPPSQMSRTAKLVEGALMIALSFVLALIPFFRMPWGGSITCFSTLPILMMSFRHGGKWGVATAALYGVSQTLYGIDSVVAAQTPLAMLLCILLDYVLAYACVGLAGPVAARFKNPNLGIVAGVSLTGLMRLACSFVSGVVIWGAWAPEGMPVWWYSLTYNAGWCLPDVAIVLIAVLLLSHVKVLYILPDRRQKTA